MTEHRPDPDVLLRRLAAAEAQTRGRLKVFFGASPGVGKTYAMLEAARAKRKEGVDVVIGWVETHGRAETAALAQDLERLPPREVEYRGVQLREFDLDGALARKPAMLLLDELAHTNAPGLRHAKRWQDVEELVEAGITVYTTLNVQHLESLNDLVNQVTGVPVRETVPDRILDAADEVEFVDLPPEELLKRLAEGKVYVPERASQAVRHFFRRGNLLALRELALRRTAEHVDADVQEYRRDHEIEPTWPVAERILVCVRPNPESDRLVRATRRMAARLRAEWIVAYVESPAQPPLTATERRALAGTFKLAEQLGAKTTSISGQSVSAAILTFAQQRNISRIVVGKPFHSRWHDRLRGSLLDEIVRGSGGIEVIVIPGGRKEAGPPSDPLAAPGRQPTPAVPALGRGRGRLHAGVLGHARPLRELEPDHGVPPGRRLRGHAVRAEALGAGRRAQRGGIRLLLRASLSHVRGRRHAVPHYVRGHAGGEPAHQHAGGQGEGSSRRRRPPGATDAGSLRR